MANWSILSHGTWADVDVILVSNLFMELCADTEVMSFGLFVGAGAHTDVMSFGNVGDKG